MNFWGLLRLAKACYPVVPIGISVGREMTGIRLTKRIIDGLEITGADYVAWDADLPGFGVRVRASGAKSYIVLYRRGLGETRQSASLLSGWSVN